MGWEGREVQEGVDIYAPMIDSCCMSEINTTWESNYLPIKNIYFLKVPPATEQPSPHATTSEACALCATTREFVYKSVRYDKRVYTTQGRSRVP